ncbi:hypothetical protein [Parasphingorhabdus sp.]|uniref:hypothetical protein n=1 Tax=Parasphingorhabdus sp. TaxID=2709688 RepID=UPI003A93B240
MNWAERTSRILQWIGTPFRVVARAAMVLVNLTPRQMQAACTLSMIGGIISNSVWIWLYIGKVERAALLGLDPESPLFTVTLSAVKYLSIMSGGFALFMCLIAFGAEWIRVKYKDFEAGTSRRAADAAREVADAADDAADAIETLEEGAD